MKKILLLSIILIGTTVFASPASDIIPSDEPVVVTRETQDEEVQKEDTKQSEDTVKQEKTNSPKTTKTKSKKTGNATQKQSEPKPVGLKIFINDKSKPKAKNPKNSKQNKKKQTRQGPCGGGGYVDLKYPR